MGRRQSTVVLLTDFGNRDGYAAVMKGVIRSICPGATVIDLSHEIGPQDVGEAAFVLWQSYKYFPSGTVFVVVIDPGVGTARKILCVKSRNYAFLAPDNGVLRFVLADLHSFRAAVVSNSKLFLGKVSATFHGRDIFAPVAAHLARGIGLSKLGPAHRISRIENQFIDPERAGPSEFQGSVVYIDRFGNVITNVRLSQGKKKVEKFTLSINGFEVSRFESSFASGPPDAPVCYRDSSGLLGVAMNRGSAAALLGARVGSTILFKFSQ